MNFWERLKEYFTKLKAWWNGLTTAQRVIVGGAIAAVTVAVVVGVIFALNPPYVLLIGGVSDEEAGNITSKLDEMKIPYRVEAGNRIYIPVKYNVYEVRMKLASAGVLGASIKGFELVEETGLGATSFDKQVRYQIALQGELERSVMTIKGIKAARVHLVLPKYTYYVRGEMKEPRASVLVVLQPGVQLSNQQIKGIMELVAGAVEGLKLENVKVIDQYSHVLSDKVLAEKETMLASSKLELKMNLENYYKNKILAPLEKLFGEGNVEVIADVKLNWVKLEKEMKKYEKPDRKGGLVRSQQTEEERAVNMPPGGGAVGTESNIPPGYQYVSGEGTGTYERKSSLVNYELNEIYERILENHEGEVESVSISVIADASSMVFGSMGKGDVLKEVKNILESGIGASASLTNLKVAVAILPFDRTMELEYKRALQESQRRVRFRAFATGLMLLTVLGFLLVYLMMIQIKKTKARKLVKERKALLEEELRKIIEKEVTVEKEEVPEKEKELKELKEKLEKVFGKDPSEIAYVIKIWITSST